MRRIRPKKDGTFAKLVAVIAVRQCRTQKAVRSVLEEFIAQLAEATWARGRFKVPGLGSFRVRRSKEREVVDPTDPLRVRRVTIPAQRVVVCRVSNQWRKR